MRIGSGWDLHRLEPGRKMILGGVEIPSDRGCIAHSDGDVLVHALIDAVLGAAALGDIGTHFPDTDPEYRGADSMLLLSRVSALLKKAGYEIVNIDTNVILEQPRLRPYIEHIRENLASLLELELAQVSVKAKTAEKIGAAGRGEAIEAHAAVLLKEI